MRAGLTARFLSCRPAADETNCRVVSICFRALRRILCRPGIDNTLYLAMMGEMNESSLCFPGVTGSGDSAATGWNSGPYSASKAGTNPAGLGQGSRPSAREQSAKRSLLLGWCCGRDSGECPMRARLMAPTGLLTHYIRFQLPSTRVLGWHPGGI